MFLGTSFNLKRTRQQKEEQVDDNILTALYKNTSYMIKLQ